MSDHDQQDLVVRGESVERVYGIYIDKRYVVNRKYQRKLVWTLDEKKKFIDSIKEGFPVPIILLAESRRGERNLFEIIDGMQRLNAIMGFLENEYPVDGYYFDLSRMADTKLLLDSGKIKQNEPVMDRDMCVRIASYTVPISIYEFAKESEVDEVFRRINSGGRKLSRQELRAAGSVGHFAQVVRKIASKIRGDVSSADELLLNDMKQISITSKDLPYGIDVDEMFWVKQGVLTKEQVRESRDEEIVADILVYTLLNSPPSSRSEFLDDYFGFGESETAQARYDEVDLAVQKNSQDVVSVDFQRVIDVIKLALITSGKTFGQLLFGAQPPRAPRYFQVVFLAFYKLIVKENKEVANYRKLAELLEGSGSSIHIPEGGRWGAADRIKAVNSAAGMYGAVFKDAKGYDPANVRWITQFENILTQSHIEQASYDFKQGFLRLDKLKKFDDAAFEKILKTLVGIANIRQGTKGYVIIGVADQEATAKRVQQVFNADSRPFERYYITGIEHEAKEMGKTLDELFQLITDRIKKSKVDETLRGYIARNVKLIKYYDKSVIILESAAQDNPSNYDGTYYIRHGNQLDVEAVDPKSFPDFFRRYISGY
jgi:hypothetical protein